RRRKGGPAGRSPRQGCAGRTGAGVVGRWCARFQPATGAQHPIQGLVRDAPGEPATISTMKTLSTSKSFGGVQTVHMHPSQACACDMTFALYLPPQAEHGKVPLLWYLSGLTCTHQKVMGTGDYHRAASERGVAILSPDTSPRGADVPDEKDNWQFGQGAGCYVDATQAPFDRDYRMQSYLLDELPTLVAGLAPVDMGRQGIFGHSMGGHGAITLALKNPGRFRAVSAFAPIVHPSTADWSRPALTKYLGADEKAWRAHDAVSLIEDGHRVPELL